MFSFASLDGSSFLGQWFSGRGAQRRRATGRSQGVAGEIASLEARRMLTGTTFASFTAGVLTLTSPDNLTQAGVLAGANNNVIVLTGGVLGTVTVSSGGAGEIFMGLLSVYNGVTKINVIANDGNDSVTLTNVKITGLVTVSGGDGDNVVTGAGGSLGSLTVTNLDGIDQTNYSNATVAGAVTISNGDGPSEVLLTTMTCGSVQVTNLEGGDVVGFNGAVAVTGTTVINNGLGSSGVVFDGGTILLGGLTITNGAGYNHEAFLGFVSAKAITITNGNGLSTTRLTSSGTIVGAVSITNAEGYDVFEIGDLLSGTGTVNITGNLTIANKGGGSSNRLKGTVTGFVWVTGLAGDDYVHALQNLNVTGTTTLNFGTGDSGADFQSSGTLNFGGTLSITSTDGVDFFKINSPNPIALKSVTLNRGNGNTTTELRGTITGNLSITSLVGNDEILAPSSLKVTGTSTLNLGNGNSTVNFQSTGTLNFGGALSITSADGNDVFQIKSPNPILLKAVAINWGLGNSSVDIDGTTITMDALSIIGNFGNHEVTFKGTSLTTKTVTLNFKGYTDIQGHATSMAINGNLSLTIIGDSNTVIYTPLNVTGTTTASLGTGHDAVVFYAGGTLTGAVSITGNSGPDRLELTGMTVMGNVTANLGTGNDFVSVDNSVFKETVGLTLGAGTDHVAVEQQNLGTETKFEKAVTINADAGADIIEVGRSGDANDFARFLLGLTVNGGLGIDQVFSKNIAQGGTRFNVFGSTPLLTSFNVIL